VTVTLPPSFKAHRRRRRAQRVFSCSLHSSLSQKRLQAAEVAVEGRSPPQLALLLWTIHPTITYTLSSGLKLSSYYQHSRKITLTVTKLKSVRCVLKPFGSHVCLFLYPVFVVIRTTWARNISAFYPASNRSFPSPITVHSCAVSIRYLYIADFPTVGPGDPATCTGPFFGRPVS
jgi:hypothetical protein